MAIDVASSLGLALDIRPFTIGEVLAGPEAFLSSATTIAMPVVSVDGRPVADGRPGRVTLALRRAFRERAERS